ncbi:MAG: hypothetical protein NC411_00225 [Bacteroides sp.]|nr:hypothetical protein [Bacteroides sp.]
MTVTRKIFAWAYVTLMSLPAFIVFNDNADTSYINLIGLAYAFLLLKFSGGIIPRWVREYLASFRTLADGPGD